MRIWSLHPKYFDRQALVAQWREGLLAKKVLEGKTKGYRNHPQLNRFKLLENPLTAINFFLHSVCDEAERRGYNFDRTKLSKRIKARKKVYVTKGQLEFEWEHLLKKLFKRSRKVYFKTKSEKKVKPHPLFAVRSGAIESWEVLPLVETN